MEKEYSITIEMLDNSDGAVTLSEPLVKKLKINTKKIPGKTPLEKCKPTFIFMFWHEKENCFAFKCATAEFANQAQCSIVAFNSEQNNIGFTPHSPNVPYIFYKLGISETKITIPVTIEHHKEHGEIYNFNNYDTSN